MTTRILLFEDDNETRKLLGTILRRQGYEVLDFPSPISCALVAEQRCDCPQEVACADVVITDMNMPGMSGLEFVRFQLEHGCHAPPRNKAVMSANLTPDQREEFAALGCRYLPKPFQLSMLLGWVEDCRRHIPPDRQLIPAENLYATAAGACS